MEYTAVERRRRVTKERKSGQFAVTEARLLVILCLYMPCSVASRTRSLPTSVLMPWAFDLVSKSRS